MDHRFWHGSQSLLRVSSMGEFWSPRCARQNERLFFLSFGPADDWHTRLHVCISCRSQRKHAQHIASVRDMLHIESSRRFRRVNTCRAHMRIRGACLGRSCACKIEPSFSTCMPIFSLYVAAKMLHMSKFGRRFRHAPILAVCQGGIKSFTPFARCTSYAKC